MSKRDMERYDDVRSLIYKLAWNFYKKYGGDFPEILAEALFLYIVSSLSYNNRRGSKFTSWISTRISKGLIDYRKRRWRKPEPYLDDLLSAKQIKHPSYSDRKTKYLVDLYDGLGVHARIVVRLVMNRDAKLKYIIKRTKGRRAERRALREYLTKHRGWKEGLVDSAFMELQKAVRSS